ncbi:hypothetical protein Presley_72 [Acinetobacter phage Presley]|uniref:Uncharacterized protein n=1 Tax=Acinetobacter phage Presley TaxID=1406780 RepID=U5PW45_9CAUD|nr:hypothetical protein Presley_72 [Acinetobacter phage Presley]AGY48139.1 hypothetical protein Presley_72 [Acinetobacter phage Presley]
MKALITTAEIIVALRTHFAIDDNVDITFSHIAGHEGIVAIADTAPTFGQAVEEVKAIASETKTTRTRRSPVKASVEAADEDNEVEEKPATTKRSFGKKKAEEHADDADQDVGSDDDEGEVEQETVKPKRTFGKTKKAVEPEPEDEDQGDDDQGQDQDDLEEEKPTPKKRTFGSKKAVKEETVEDDDADQDDGEAEEQPAKRTFGARKTVFGKR